MPTENEAKAITGIHFELGEITDGDGVVLNDEAVIFFVGDDGSSEIRICSPYAREIASRIVHLWNEAKGA